MLFISVSDFFEQVSTISPLSREKEKTLAQEMASGDLQAREALIFSYLPLVSSHIKRLSPEYQTLELVLRSCQALEKVVDRFDFMQDGERFSHRLSWWLRQTTVQYITEKRNLST